MPWGLARGVITGSLAVAGGWHLSVVKHPLSTGVKHNWLDIASSIHVRKYSIDRASKWMTHNIWITGWWFQIFFNVHPYLWE